MVKKRSSISEKMIYEFCQNSKNKFLKKVTHKIIKEQSVKDIQKCYSALYRHGAAWHPLLTKLKKEIENKQLNLDLFPE